MSNIITKELLGEVLKIEVVEIVKIVEANLELKLVGQEYIYINIYELAHLVRKWCEDNNYQILLTTRGFLKVTEKGRKWDEPKDSIIYEYDYSKELESIFKAGEWVRLQKCK